MVERLARLGRNMLLARVIAPDQFGIMAIVLAVIALFDALTEVGVAQAVIQNKRGGTPEFLNIAWWFSLLRGVLIVAVSLPFIPAIASFYDQPSLEQLLAVAMVSMVFTGATSPRIYALQREFRFGATLWTTQGSGILGTLFTLGLGLYLRDVWALVWGTVFEAFARFVLSFIFCPIRPRLHLDRAARAELFKFTRGMAGLPILTFILLQADTFVLGKVVSAEVLGLYSMAIVLSSFPLTVFSKVVQPMVVPLFATFQENLDALRGAFLRITTLVWMFGLPMGTYLAVFSGPILTTVYGSAYAAAAGPFAVYSFYTVVYMSSMVSFSVYLALARPGTQRAFTILRAALIIVTMYPMAVWLGPVGAALSLLGCLTLAMLLQLYNLRKVIGVSPISYLATLSRGALSAVGVAALSIPILLYVALPPLALSVVGALPLAASWCVSLFVERRVLQELRKDRVELNPGEDT